MSQIQVLDGIGKTKITIREGGVVKYSHTFPLAKLNGYARQIEEKGLMHEVMSLDINNPQIEEVPFRIGFMNTFTISWEGFPLSLAEAEQVLNCWNACTNSREITIEPKVGYGYTEIVNNITGTITMAQYDSANERGNYGFKLVFRSRRSQPSIQYVVPPVIEIGIIGGEVAPVFGGIKET